MVSYLHIYATLSDKIMITLTLDDIQNYGFSLLDKDLQKGPVHIVKNKHPKYVVLTEKQYKELLANEQKAYLVRVQKSLKDLKQGKFKQGNIKDLIKELRPSCN